MNLLVIVFLIIAFACFVRATMGLQFGKLNATALGFCFLTLAFLAPALGTLIVVG